MSYLVSLSLPGTTDLDVECAVHDVAATTYTAYVLVAEHFDRAGKPAAVRLWVERQVGEETTFDLVREHVPGEPERQPVGGESLCNRCAKRCRPCPAVVSTAVLTPPTPTCGISNCGIPNCGTPRPTAGGSALPRTCLSVPTGSTTRRLRSTKCANLCQLGMRGLARYVSGIMVCPISNAHAKPRWLRNPTVACRTFCPLSARINYVFTPEPLRSPTDT